MIVLLGCHVVPSLEWNTMKSVINLILMCSVLIVGAIGVNKFQSISTNKNIFADHNKAVMAQMDLQ